MRGPGQVILTCESVEDVAPKGQSNLQAGTIVAADSLDGQPESPSLTGKTQIRGGKKVLAKRKRLAPTELLRPVDSSQTVKSGNSQKKSSQLAKLPTESCPASFSQLSLWDYS